MAKTISMMQALSEGVADQEDCRRDSVSREEVRFICPMYSRDNCRIMRSSFCEDGSYKSCRVYLVLKEIKD